MLVLQGKLVRAHQCNRSHMLAAQGLRQWLQLTLGARVRFFQA